jgi:hypothetical protein
MTAKKKISTKRKADGSKRRALETRARAIIADVRGYDYDTRHTIAAALDDESLTDRQLDGMCAQAEAGELVEHPMDCFETDYHTVAHRTVRFLETDLPDWLLQVMCQTINATAHAFNIEVLPADSDGNFSARRLATLFRVSELTQYAAPTLADLISGVLTHPDTPPSIYNALSQETSSLTSAAVVDSPEVIRLMLAEIAREGGGR